MLLLVVVDSNVLEERTNEVSLVGSGGIAERGRRAGCMPFWNSSLLRPLFVQVDVYGLRFGSFSRPPTPV